MLVSLYRCQPSELSSLIITAWSTLLLLVTSQHELPGVPGVPGRDYPLLASVPPTLFSCRGQVDGGYYADPQTNCQAFHVCVDQGEGNLNKISFLCPNGTLFQQEYFTCDWWFNVDCSTARRLWSINREIADQRSQSRLYHQLSSA